jgi:hypothetical protein
MYANSHAYAYRCIRSMMDWYTATYVVVFSESSIALAL